MVPPFSEFGGAEGLGVPSDACSIIVPIDLSRRPLGVLRRLRAFLDASWPLGCTEVVVAHLVYGTRWDLALERIVASRRAKGRNVVLAQARRLHHESGIPLGRLRNIGAHAASCEELLFADVDLVLPAHVILQARRLRHRLGLRFVSIPVVYLSNRVGARAARRIADSTAGSALDRLLRLAVHGQMEGLALNSSLIFVSSQHYRQLGGFHEVYFGHGFEDFDLLMRLAHADEQKCLPASVLVNVPQASPGLAVGFRSYLARFTAPVLGQGVMAFHLHHWRPKGDGYFEARGQNYRLFCERMRSLGIVDDEGAKAGGPQAFTSQETAALVCHALGLGDVTGSIDGALPLFSRPGPRRKTVAERLAAWLVSLCERVACRWA